MVKKLLISLLIIGCVATVFCFGAYYGQETFEPQVEYVEVEVEKVIHIATYEKVEVEVIKEVEVVVEKPVILREFTSLTELEEWLADDRTSALHYVFDWGGPWRINPLFQDCDDYAYALQQVAMKDGYLMSIQIDTRKEHALNSVFIGNKVYFVEPQTDEVWFECYRDKE